MSLSTRDSMAAQNTARQRTRAWVSDAAVPFLANRAASLEIAGRAVVQAAAEPTRRLRNDIRERPLAAIVVAAGVGYLLATIGARSDEGPRREA